MLKNMDSLLKRKRIEKRISLRELEQITGITDSYLSALELGDKDNVSFELLGKISEALDIDIDVVMVNIGRLPDSFFFARKDKPEELTKALKKLLKTFEKKYYDKG